MSDVNCACKGVAAFWVQEGSHAHKDLGGVAFALYNFFPAKISSGNWHMGLVVDTFADNEQTIAIEQIISGHDRGPFGSIGGLVGEYLGLERAEIRFGGGSWPTVAIDDHGGFKFEPVLDRTGTPLLASHPMLPFARDCVVGRTVGQHCAFGETWKPAYGEYARFDFHNETLGLEQAIRRRP